MSSSKIDIHLENYTNHYFSGGSIIGHVLCTFPEPKVVHGIILKIKGEAVTHWVRTTSTYNHVTKRNDMITIPCHGSYQIVHQEIDLLNKFGAETTIPQGVHKYPFTYKLPENLPSSFEHNLGKITYNIKATVKRPLLKPNYEVNSNFLIVTPVNLNHFPIFQEPKTMMKVKRTHFLCRSRGNINVSMYIPKSGFALYEPLPLHLQVENLSRSKIDEIKVKIVSIKKFTVMIPSAESRMEYKTICKASYSGVGVHGENTYDEIVRINDPTMVSNHVNTNVIDVSYELKICFVIAGMHSNIDFTLPVLVGHIPYGIEPPMAPNTVGDLPPAYGFVEPQPAYNPDVARGIPRPVSYNKGTEAGFGDYLGYPPPGGPSAPDLTVGATAPPKEFEAGFRHPELPSYDQVMKM